MTRQLRILDVEGGPRERGRAHGEEVRDLIHEVIARWHDDIGLDVGNSVDAYLEEFLDRTDFRSAIKRWTPDLFDEVAGITEGAGLSESACMSWQLLDEEWWYRERHLARASGGGERCSAAGGAVADGRAVIGQNMDIEAYHDGSQVLLRSRTAGLTPDSLVVTTAGMIGLTGLNRSGVGVCVNSLPQLTPTPSGLPVAFVIRGVLGCRTSGSVSEFLRSVTHASGQNYLVGSPEGIVDLECSAGQAQEVEPKDGRLIHTNHPLENSDFATDRPAVPVAAQREQRPPSTTTQRFDVLEREVTTGSGAVTTQLLYETLSDRSAPVSVVPSDVGDFMTFASVVMELSDDPVLHVAPGPPHRTPFEDHTFV